MKMNINNIKENKVVVKTSSINEIKIPMIQRDYVQGLDDKKLVPFLNALINTLSHQSKTQQIKTLSLDFIYGNINEDGVFEPIDGQQRLTTLALLTFYLYCRQKNSNNKIKNPFTYITYATRQSAKKFCELLAEYEYTDKFGNNKPSNVIKKNPKYFREYDEDTTISAMLKTLDKIHEIINDKKPNINNNTGQDDIQSFINTLASNIDKINFHIFPMESLNLSDDLYIKMNGRGKQLSSFDNFKADYFKWLEEVCNNDNIDNLIPNSIESDKYKKLETLKRKFDTDYIDIFWDYALKNSEDTDETPDPEKLFFRFINRFVVGKYLFLTDTQKNNIKNDFEKTFFDDGIKSEKDAVVFNNIELYKSILNEQDNDKKYTYNYKIINILENLSNLQKYCSNNFKDILNFIFNPLWEDEELNIFPKKDWLTYKQVLIFNAITSFLEQDSIIDNYKCDKCNKLKERVIDNKTFLINEECNIYNILITLKRISRIVWNITEQYNLLNTISKDNYKTVMSRLDFSKLGKLENVYYKFQNICGDVDDYKKIKKHNVNNDENDIDIIIKDEVRKCQYLYNDNKIDTSLEQQFIKLEKLPYLKGSIGFLLGTNKEDFGNIYDNAFSVFSPTSKDNMLNNGEFIKLLVYTIFDNIYSDILNNNSDILFNKLFDDISIRKYLIVEDIFKSKAYSVIKEKPNIPAKYDDFIEKYINDFNDNLRDVFIIYCVAALLYFKDSNTKEYIINTHFIDTTKFPCIMENNYKKYAYYGLYKRFASIIIEQNICNFIEKITQNNSIIYNDNNADVYLIKFDINNNVYKAYNHLIYGNDGTIMLFLKIHDIKYTLWFLYNPEEYTFGLTDETDSNNKVEYKMNYVKEKFASDLENIMNCIQELANDRNLTLSEYMKK